MFTSVISLIKVMISSAIFLCMVPLRHHRGPRLSLGWIHEARETVLTLRPTKTLILVNWVKGEVYTIHYTLQAATPLEAPGGTLNVFLLFQISNLRNNCLCCVQVSTQEFFNLFYDFSWEVGGKIPQNSYKTSRDLCETTLLEKTRSVQRLARSFLIISTSGFAPSL